MLFTLLYIYIYRFRLRNVMYSASFFSILTDMKLNCEDRDACSLLHDQIFDQLHANLTVLEYMRSVNKAIASIIFFGSRLFCKHLLEVVTGLRRTLLTKDILRFINLCDNPHLMFTPSFTTGRLRRRPV